MAESTLVYSPVQRDGVAPRSPRPRNSALGTVDFPLREAQGIVRDLFRARPALYWLDFGLHVTLGWGAFVATLLLSATSPWRIVTLAVAVLALYRAVIFTHELAHAKTGSLGVFRAVWNLTCGFPLMVPSFTYRGVHNDHHKRDIYGTARDGEYVPFGLQEPHTLVLYPLLSLALPFVLVARFVILAPLSLLHPGLRRLTWERLSSLTIDWSYRRPAPTPRDGRTWRLQEFLTFLYGAGAIGLAATGMLPWRALGLWVVVAFLIFLLNSLRTLAAHRYRNPSDRKLGFADQYLDSVNVPGNRLLTALWAPVGLRYHATHHLFPGMPYHALGTAHHRLVAGLSDNSLYLQTVRSSLWHALASLWRDSSSHPRSG